MRLIIVFTSILALSHSSLYGKGLKDLTPEKETPAKEEPSSKADPKPIVAPEVPADKAVDVKSKKDGDSKSATHEGLGHALLMGIDLGIHGVSGATGDWSSGMSGGFTLGYKVLPFGKNADIYASYSFNPVDVIVTLDQEQYRGVIETHYFGALARFQMRKKFIVTANADLGFASAQLDAINYITPGSKDPEASGAALRIGGSALWKFQDNVSLGGGINLALGTFSGWNVVFGTQFTL